MANKSIQAKVSVATEDGQLDLCTLNKSEGLESNVKMLCERFCQTPYTKYGLKLMSTKDGRPVDNFITYENFDDIEDGQNLKLTRSVKTRVSEIFEHLHDDQKENSFNDLLKMSSDPGFIKEIVHQEKQQTVIDLLLADLNQEENAACLAIVLNLFKLHYIKLLDLSVVSKILQVTKRESSNKELLTALAIMCQILLTKSGRFKELKHLIIEQIRFCDLTPYLRYDDQKNIQINTLMLMNTMVKCVKDEKRLSLVKEMNLRTNREIIFKHIIKNGKIHKAMERELYVYQTFVLSLYDEGLKSTVNTSNNLLFKREEFELGQYNENNHLLEFEDLAVNSQENSETVINDEAIYANRFSIVSIMTNNSNNTILSTESDTSTQSYGSNGDKMKICHLTLENLKYYRNEHHKSFRKSIIEETAYEPGIYATAENVTQMLARILHIGKQPERNCTFYQPLVFNVKLKKPFFPELFSRTMWLLSKTRREMKASIKEDYSKVLQVLERQMQTILEKRPPTYKELTATMARLSYKYISEIMQIERNEQWKKMLETNPSIQELKNQIRPSNENLIFEQRIRCMQAGEYFPKLPILVKKGKIPNYLYVKLSENRQKITLTENDETSTTTQKQVIDITDIKYLVTGKACPHIKDHTVKDDERVFTLMLHNNTTTNFLAKDEKTANYWIDGLSLLLGKENRSDYYKHELNILMDMDCNLQLLELQEVILPNEPPPIPENIPDFPTGYGPKPVPPPKSPHLLNKKKRTIKK